MTPEQFFADNPAPRTCGDAVDAARVFLEEFGSAFLLLWLLEGQRPSGAECRKIDSEVQ